MHNGLNALTRRILGVVAIALALAANTASADYLFAFSNANEGVANNLTIDSSVRYSGVNQGWWSATFSNNASNPNYFVGLATEEDDENVIGEHLLNNFFIFDISNLSAPASSAVLNLQFFEAYSSTGAAILTYSLFDVSTNLALLNANTGTSLGIFNDLGSGTSYGSFSISTSHGFFDVVSLTLNSAGLADLNAAISGGAQQFAIGGMLTPTPVVDQHNSVPDSANTLVLFGLAAAGIWSLRNRKRAA